MRNTTHNLDLFSSALLVNFVLVDKFLQWSFYNILVSSRHILYISHNLKSVLVEWFLVENRAERKPVDDVCCSIESRVSCALWMMKKTNRFSRSVVLMANFFVLSMYFEDVLSRWDTMILNWTRSVILRINDLSFAMLRSISDQSKLYQRSFFFSL
jgi:hypothetical protein